jgi:hypothetical protein
VGECLLCVAKGEAVPVRMLYFTLLFTLSFTLSLMIFSLSAIWRTLRACAVTNVSFVATAI